MRERKRPYIIEIEGVDGSGKLTQATNLSKMLTLNGYNVRVYSFPAYNDDSSFFVKNYQSGKYNELDLNPYQISAFYSIDRVLQWKKIEKECRDDDVDIIIFDRYIGSNLIYQGARIRMDNRDDWRHKDRKFYNFIQDQLQYEVNTLDLPRANIVFYLGIPLETSKKLREGRLNKQTGENEQDINESNDELIDTCTKVGEILSRYLQWDYIDCTFENSTSMRPINDITKELFDISLRDINSKCFYK